MFLLDKLFPKKQPFCRREMPAWEEIVAHMQGKELSFFTDTIVRVMVSIDHAKRIIILRSDHGYYKTVYEEIQVWDEDEWYYCSSDPDRYPAYWNPIESSINNKSFYGTEHDAFKAITESHEYKNVFCVIRTVSYFDILKSPGVLPGGLSFSLFQCIV